MSGARNSQAKIPVITIGENGDWKTSQPNSSANGITTQLIEIQNSDSISLSVNMLGSYNATNAACALAASQILGLPMVASLESLKNVRSIPGRLEKVTIDSPGTAIVDYAHT
jgi:UDP-N-acetylmuramoyl-L-alanyl-D-glutamate--2,6-diaminopimelate ligase